MKILKVVNLGLMSGLDGAKWDDGDDVDDDDDCDDGDDNDDDDGDDNDGMMTKNIAWYSSTTISIFYHETTTPT